jgi:iron complex outermembrane receptor protein
MNFLSDKILSAPTMMPNMPMATHGINEGLSVKANIDITDKHLLTLGSEYQRYRLSDWWNPIGSDITKGMQGPAPYWNINEGRRDRIDMQVMSWTMANSRQMQSCSITKIANNPTSISIGRH